MPTQTDPVLGVLKSKLNETVAEYERVEQEQKNREKIITSLKTSIQVLLNPETVNLNEREGLPVFEPNGFRYPEGTSWRDRIIAFMKFKQRLVTTNEIVDGIATVETGLNKKQILNMVSGNLSTLVKDEIVKTYKPKKMKGQYYGSPLWFEDNGEVVEKYKPEEKQVSVW